MFLEAGSYTCKIVLAQILDDAGQEQIMNIQGGEGEGEEKEKERGQ